MKISVIVDKAGRMVLPKKIREAMGIYGRMALDMELVGYILQLTLHKRSRRALMGKHGRLVYPGRLPKNWDSGEAVQHQRRLRILKLAGQIEFRPDWRYKNMRSKP